MTTMTLTVNGAALEADRSGALYWPERRLLVVSDLHLEKGSSYAARGLPLPPYDTAETLRRLAEVCGRFRPDAVICLGDSFHDMGGPERLATKDRETIARLAAGRDWIWIAGNHDPELPASLPGRMAVDLTAGPLVFRHEASASAGEISGHYHPSARIKTRGRLVGGKCFVTDGRRLVMPAFGAYTGGLDVLAAPLRAVFAGEFEILFLGPRRLYRFPRAALV